jgi:hypothetical protein
MSTLTQASNTYVKVGNSALGYSVTIAKNALPVVVYPENSPFAMSKSEVKKIRVYINGSTPFPVVSYCTGGG